MNDLFSPLFIGGKGDDLSEITYYTCLKVLSEALGKVPLHLIDAENRRIEKHELNRVLKNRPNEKMTPTAFFSYLEMSRNHYGNGYAYIVKKPGGELESLQPLDARRVQIWVDNTKEFTRRGYFYRYSDISGKSYDLLPKDVIHVKSWLLDDNQLLGRSVREILATSLTGTKASTEFLNEMYQRGLLARAVIKYVGDLKPSSQEALLNRIEEQASTNGRRMIALPIGFDLQTLDMKLADNQFFELKRYSAQQIAAAFGVNPVQLNDYSRASYANSAAQNLSFYVDSLLPILSQYEDEMSYKLLKAEEVDAGLRLKFNVGVILRADPSAQAEIISKLISNGVYSLDEARAWLDMPPHEGELGKTPLVNAAYKPLAAIENEDVMSDDTSEKRQ